ncbi:hypothetical protein SARC_07158 [Sphaeroforma arctica JP610]|uniref:Uncharacterized protein n=1 Tax=Sphaeroforma arctica JP610 TaxID=667725 RepID=A0A0L0FV96_9EUKA|nr:hypothetical protein SARC_07158 [Sphaeroforma arctica JP610]KNC80481.1 hypothetical protein SARC_07158 [Sphaeroforma arctica JP610]|eukprot:XP_014154383.1 hypothetical protein SARC_07158 [Sphaeroforma arctica JP610]
MSIYLLSCCRNLATCFALNLVAQADGDQKKSRRTRINFPKKKVISAEAGAAHLERIAIINKVVTKMIEMPNFGELHRNTADYIDWRIKKGNEKFLREDLEFFEGTRRNASMARETPNRLRKHLTRVSKCASKIVRALSFADRRVDLREDEDPKPLAPPISSEDCPAPAEEGGPDHDSSGPSTRSYLSTRVRMLHTGTLRERLIDMGDPSENIHKVFDHLEDDDGVWRTMSKDF